MRTLITGAVIVNEEEQYRADLVIEDDRISEIIKKNNTPRDNYDHIVDATGCFVLPGVIDEHVHFREPGLTQKADIESESRAAAYGGVTSFFDMPNTKPQTTSIADWNAKRRLGAEKSHVNYAFFYGATNDNADTFCELDEEHVPGIKLFMGASTGNMLVDKQEALEKIFATADKIVMTHCEDTEEINCNMAKAKALYGEDPDVKHHPEIRSEQACYASSSLAVQLAKKYRTFLHIAHLSTAHELELIPATTEDNMQHALFAPITSEAVIAHLMFCDEDYERLGTRIKCNPAVKTKADRDALRRALTDGRITCVATDHAPHQLADKEGGCAKAASGMPMIQFSLVSMLELVDNGVLPLTRLVRLMSHNPALLFSVEDRGFIQPDFKADLVIVRPNSPWTVDPTCIQSKCKWSPMEGHTFNWRVEHTFCNGHHLYNKGVFDADYRGEEICFL